MPLVICQSSEAVPLTPIFLHSHLLPASLGASDPISTDPLYIYNWELATVGLAQYDVAELLSFYSPAIHPVGCLLESTSLKRSMYDLS